MSQQYLHIQAGNRYDNASVIAGDHAALVSLRRAIDQALSTGSGGTSLLTSDGEPHKVAIVLENNMYPVYTSYAHEAAPQRSRRETVPIDQLPNYTAALNKAQRTREPTPEEHTALAAFVTD